MKTTIHGFLVLLSALVVTNSYAGKRSLWTTMNGGGANGLGAIYTVNEDGSNGGVAINFNGVNGANPNGNLVKGNDNVLYGTTLAGGLYNYGVMFSYDPATQVFAVLHHFNGTDGREPGDLLLSADGWLYGTSRGGGTHSSPSAPDGAGVLFRYHTGQPNSFQVVVDFNGVNGTDPQGLMQAADGNIFGMTRRGGVNDRGTIFCFQPLLNTFAVVHSFSGLNGELPTKCRLLQANNGNLYGMTTWGGLHDFGVVFCYNIPTKIFTKLHDFDGSDGAWPMGTLMQASNGKLYGVTPYGGTYDAGEIFSYEIAPNLFTPIYSFDGALGSAPIGSLMEGEDGVLYGVTPDGGQYGLGVIFNFNIFNNSYSVVSHCDGTNDGAKPMSNVVEYGTTTGIEEEANVTISMFPNPAREMVTFKTGDFVPQTITVTNLSGQQVLQQPYTPQLSIETLPAGIYNIELRAVSNLAKARVIKVN